MRELREQDILLWLCTTQGVGGVTVRRLQEHFGSWQAIWEAEEAEWVHGAGVRVPQARALSASRAAFDPVRERSVFEPEGIRFVSQLDLEYPDAFREIYDPPAGFFLVGQLPRTRMQSLAVVGSRHPTSYGRVAAKHLVSECAGKGLTIVSGLARGIDTIAHAAALEAGGQTVAVLGGGLLQVYPKENRALAHRIADGNGAVLSEWHPLTAAKPSLFPVRNRLISALSQGVLVVEAGERSGSLITADSALEQGRDVYAVPGPITSPQSMGTNRLIAQGAKPVLTAQDLVEDFALPVLQAVQAENRQEIVEKEALRVLDALGHEELHVDELLRRTGYEIGVLHRWLLRLQAAGRVGALPGGRYVCVQMQG